MHLIGGAPYKNYQNIGFTYDHRTGLGDDW